MDEDYGGDGKSATAVYAPDEISSLDIAHTPLHHAPAIIEHVHLSSECKAPAGLAWLLGFFCRDDLIRKRTAAVDADVSVSAYTCRRRVVLGNEVGISRDAPQL
jgi:hypothetical protein